MTTAPRILFVDDEPRILEGIENLLFDHSEWDAAFATSGEAAVQTLRDEAPFDVLVTDMRMPGMDGLALLQHVLKEQPHMMRIVLSGDAELKNAMEAFTIAHQYLAKPCTEATLVATIQRALHIRAVVQDDQLRRNLGMISETPHDLVCLHQVRELASRDDVSIAEVARAVTTDVGLATKVVQAASSAMFGGPAVTTVAAAVQRIGLNSVRALATAMEMYARLPISAAFREDRHRSLKIASIAAAISTEVEAGDHAYLCALLHDLGTLTLRSVGTARAAQCAARRQRGEGTLTEVEQAEFGIDHAHLGAEILVLFEMPDIAEVIRHHHHPSTSGRPARLDAIAALHIAEAAYDEQLGFALELDAEFLESLGPLAEMTLFRARRLARS